MSDRQGVSQEAPLPGAEWYYPESPRTIPQPDEVKEGIRRALKKIAFSGTITLETSPAPIRWPPPGQTGISHAG